MKKYWKYKDYLLKLNFSEKLFIFIYFFYILRLHFRQGLQHQSADFGNIAIIFLGAISAILIFKIVEAITRWNRFLHVLVKILIICIYLLISDYHIRTRHNLDFAIILDNSNLIFYKESFFVVLNTFKSKDIIIALSFFFSLILLEIFKKSVSKTDYKKNMYVQFFVSLSLYVLIMTFSPYTYEELSGLNKSMLRYFFSKEAFQVSAEYKAKQFPYINEPSPKVTPLKDRPNIFIVLVESYNANFVLTRNEQNQEYTPFYNSMIKKGLYFNNFWGHSVQTAKGQLATFCSLLPTIRKKVFVNYPDIKLKCLPDILKNYNYETLFFKAFNSMEFDNTGYFAKKHGFDHVHGMTNKFITPQESKMFSWGWGIQDSIFYKKFFKYVDDLHNKNKLAQKKFFAILTTVSNHQKFRDVPKDQRYLYPNQSNKKQFYANNIRVSDEYLKTFFEEFYKRDYLKNSIIIVTGDHSFPVGEHYSYYAENGFYTENFRIPFLFIWNNNDKFKGIVNHAKSQLDIAPTLLEILGISEKNHFLGKSFLDNKNRFIPLIQPYDGTYVGAVYYPYKYMFHQKTKMEYLYNLKKDPKEMVNIIDSIKNTKLYQDFHHEVAKIFYNTTLIKENRIWNK
ncbi:MAG: sulfatase-like hydrolase/transferase [Bacteriovoracaceae bacterium]|nr:sulfatase-like hydrolase/transferase [Bacteriovoracaceae bacterium]